MYITFDGVNFTAKSILKTEFFNGNIPLKRDITGTQLNKHRISIDHTIPKSKGGKSVLYNYSLIDSVINNKRGSKPIQQYIDLESFIEYIRVMLNVKTEKFDGIEYLKQWLKTLQKAVKENK